VIKTVVIDDLLKAGQLPAPSFVKIDVEGAEGQVLQGMRRTLASAKPALFIECSDAGRGNSLAIAFRIGLPLSVSHNTQMDSHFRRLSSF
jgi:hypothetical protein